MTDHVFDSHTGEVRNVCEDCLSKDKAISRLSRSYEGTIQHLRMELDDRRSEQKKLEPAITDVALNWCRHAETSGWWSEMPGVTDSRYDATRAAVNKGYTPGYLMMVNQGAFMSSATERKNPRFKRAWLEPWTIYGKNIDTHFEFAKDPSNEKVRAIFEIPKVLRDRWLEVVDLADPCDCGHIRLDHHKPLLTEEDLSFGACRVLTCGCEGFDDFHVSCDRWLDGQGWRYK